MNCSCSVTNCFGVGLSTPCPMLFSSISHGACAWSHIWCVPTPLTAQLRLWHCPAWAFGDNFMWALWFTFNPEPIYCIQPSIISSNFFCPPVKTCWAEKKEPCSLWKAPGMAGCRAGGCCTQNSDCADFRLLEKTIWIHSAGPLI